MAKSFEAQVDDWAKMSEARLVAVFRQSAQDLGEAVNTPKAKGGNLPVDTGFLRASFGADVNSTPRGSGTTEFNMQALIVAIQRAVLGDELVFGYAANYAKKQEAKNGFIRLNVQKWPSIVKKANKQVKQDYKA